ncbi:MAG TPA: EamA family transporter [Chitinophagaceae bacterium]|nr:EamA family transporter [Chitinophagaceae bacterium]
MAPIQTSTKKASQALVITAFAALYIIWGSTYLAILIAVKSIPPFLMAGSRFIIAGLLLYGWCRFRGEATPDFASIRKISFSGILLLFIGNSGLVWVEQYLPSGFAAIVIATVPLWFVILDKRQWKFHFANKQIIIGLLIGFAGVLSLFAGKSGVSFNGKYQLISFFVLVLGSISWATGSLYGKYTPSNGSTSMKAAIQMLAAGLVSMLTGIFSGELQHFSFSQISTEALLAVAYLVSFGSLIGYMSFVWLMTVRPPSLVGTYAYVNPVVAVFLGWLFAHEQITWHQLIALAIILAGVIIVNLSKEKLTAYDSKTLARKSAVS